MTHCNEYFASEDVWTGGWIYCGDTVMHYSFHDEMLSMLLFSAAVIVVVDYLFVCFLFCGGGYKGKGKI